MTVRVAISGMGRIGRMFFRAATAEGSGIEVVAVNDLANTSQLVHLLNYDSVAGRRGPVVEARSTGLLFADRIIPVSSQPDPAMLAWSDLGVDIVVESSRVREADLDPTLHLKAGADHVLLPRPAADADAVVVSGVNTDEYDPLQHKIVSIGSCTLNCIALLVDVLEAAFGLESAIAMTVHSYTNDQTLLDGGHRDLRHGRAAALNIIPSPDKAAATLGRVIPSLGARVTSEVIRVPTANGCLVDLTAVLSKRTDKSTVNRVFADAALDPRRMSTLTYSTEPLVSSDVIGSPASCIFDANLTMVRGDLAKVVGWFDNEWSQACRLVDLCRVISGFDHNGVRRSVPL